MKRSAILIIVLISFFLIQPLFAQDLPKIQFEKYELSNGLDVILYENHDLPTVTINIWYHVGSKNEKPGRTGFAHLFEHMMFQGSEHNKGEYFTPLQKAGGILNGSTTEDRTNYWEDLPSNYLELGLWAESDRMGFLLPEMTEDKLKNQIDVVKNERRQGNDNQPYGKANELILDLLYSKSHPYSWPIIGSLGDLTVATLEDVKTFFATYYTPNNASLCVAGDFDPEITKQLIEKYFGSIPPGPAIERLTEWVPQLNETRKMLAQDNVNLPRLYYAWHTPAYYQPGDAQFNLLSSILTGGKNSRLYKTLVYDKQIAQEVWSYQASREIGSHFQIEATAREGHTLDEIAVVIDEELKKLMTVGITENELIQAKNQMEVRYISQLEKIGDFGGIADKLNEYNVRLGDPDGFQKDLDRYLKTTVAEVNLYAKTYLDLNRRVILQIVPKGDYSAAETELDRSVQPGPIEESKFEPPAIQRDKLSIGCDILLVKDDDVPIVQLNVIFNGGWADDPKDKPSVSSITADLLNEGTKTRNALQIADELKTMGSYVFSYSFFDGSSVGLFSLKKHLDKSLDIMADVLLNPTFPMDELDRIKKNYKTSIIQEEKDPFVSSLKVFQKLLYGEDHPYSQPFTGTGTLKSLEMVQHDDIVNYYRSHYLPDNATFVVVGDIEMSVLKGLLEKKFKGWKSGEIKHQPIPELKPLTETKIYIVDKPDAAQSQIVIGHYGIKRNDSDYTALQVMNKVLGGQFTSRLNLNLREDKGYTYGIHSNFLDSREVGPFYCSVPVDGKYTKESVVEIVRELREIVSLRPINDEELLDSKTALIKALPRKFEEIYNISDELSDILLYGLPDNYWQKNTDQIYNLDALTVNQATKSFLQPEKLIIVVVGDRKQIEAGLKDLKLGEVVILDPETLK